MSVVISAVWAVVEIVIVGGLTLFVLIYPARAWLRYGEEITDELKDADSYDD